MNFWQRGRNVLRGLVQRHGSAHVKKFLWNREFSTGRWNYLDKTGDERVHLLIEKYADNGHVLDLGCGSGTTSIEMNPAAYCSYVGVDISDVAVRKARTRAREAGRADRNEYCQSDIVTYVPTRRCNVILFGESLYYVAPTRIPATLARYSKYLTENGVFVVRLFDGTGKRLDILDCIEGRFQVIERHLRERTQACLVVFRPLPDERSLIVAAPNTAASEAVTSGMSSASAR